MISGGMGFAHGIEIKSNRCLSACLVSTQNLIADRGRGYRKAMSLRGGRKPDVAIRSKNVSIIWEFRVKTVVFQDADCLGHRWPRNDNA